MPPSPVDTDVSSLYPPPPPRHPFSRVMRLLQRRPVLYSCRWRCPVRMLSWGLYRLLTSWRSCAGSFLVCLPWRSGDKRGSGVERSCPSKCKGVEITTKSTKYGEGENRNLYQPFNVRLICPSTSHFSSRFLPNTAAERCQAVRDSGPSSCLSSCIRLRTSDKWARDK
jgi:hypothetical protein